jgi:Lipocalin-like domain
MTTGWIVNEIIVLHRGQARTDYFGQRPTMKFDGDAKKPRSYSTYNCYQSFKVRQFSGHDVKIGNKYHTSGIFGALRNHERLLKYRLFIILNFFIIMQKLFFALVALSLSVLSFSACKKEKSFAEELTGTWKSQKFSVDGTEMNQSSSLQLVLQASNEFDMELTTKNLLTGQSNKTSSTGDWTEDEKKRDISLKFDTGESYAYDVTELTETTMHVEYVNGGKRFVIVFTKG